MKSSTPTILYCHCAHTELLPLDSRQKILAALAASGAPFLAVPDLCELAARQDPVLKELADAGPLTIVACYPRAIRALFQAAGSPLIRPDVTLLNQRVQTAEEIIASIAGLNPGPTETPPPTIEKNGVWIPWFPVLDRSRCKNCKQCLSFCLFGVYGLGPDGRVQVSHPQNCKNNCPACARICPDVAIIFPKFGETPINGAPIQDEDLERAKVKIKTQEILGSNVYAALAERRKNAQTRQLIKAKTSITLLPIGPDKTLK